ncbi:DUF937 domain-containing protein [Cumulibacter manganitolerans]|uniref:DUF937 domain-containing protein n=1 Tax=Cumulibacter manganitolerans TaxID=1884992 RepID=UPI0012956D3C|nr:DUF937 domain-containing protein [Cumulibacter manganitolerans]
MNDIDSLIAQIPLSQVARTLGVDERTASEAVRAAVPALVGGLGANAQDPAGEQSLAQALERHQGADPATLFDLGAQDERDGAKIVHHVFGGNTGQVVDQLAGARPALGSDMLAKLLPLLAPIVLKWLAAKWSQRSGGTATRSGTPASGGVGQSPAGFPAPADAGSPSSAPEHRAGGGLGDLLGGLLGGSGGGLGDLLGGLLGRGRK